jgi:myo-inositol-1(or 4)-monophosphatase
MGGTVGINSIADALDLVKQAGEVAVAGQQRAVAADNRYKPDGSIVTDIDFEVEELLVRGLSRLYPQANIIAEEGNRFFDVSQPYTFTLDPIDGTEVFSQGMTGWCISLCLHGMDMDPVAGIVYAPRLDVLLFADVGRPALLNGRELPRWPEADVTASDSTLMVSSRIHRELEMTGYPGKLRSIGSAALHLSFPAIYPGVHGAIQHPGAHIWDISGAHAILTSRNLQLIYWDGQEIDYQTLANGRPIRGVTVAGTPRTVADLRRLLPRR